MCAAKTQPTAVTLTEFLDALPEQKRRADCAALAAMMAEVTGEPAVLWGSSIVGFGRYRLRYADGSEAEWPIIGFSPRKNDLTLYLVLDLERTEALLARLGRHKTSKVCLYLKKLADVDNSVLLQLIQDSVAAMEPRRIR